MRYDTEYYKLTDVFNNGQIGQTPDCVYVTIPKDEVWDLLESLLRHVKDEGDKDFDLCFPCELKKCELYGGDLPKDSE